MSEPEPPPGMEEGDRLRIKGEWLRKMRGELMVVAVLVASVTYQAGLNPPGGFWQDDMSTYQTEESRILGGGHFAGDPVLRDKNFNRYATFLGCNTVAFVQSLGIIVLLMSESSFRGRLRLYLLRVFVVLDVTALGIAYAMGSTRDSYDIYYSAFVFLILILFVAVTGFSVHHHYKTKEERNSMRRSMDAKDEHVSPETDTMK